MMKPTLVILAAGMGSRYGGLKQIDAVGNHGESIIDFSIYDAYRAGFRKVVLIIRKEHEQAFDEALGNKIRRKMELEYAYQDLHDVPDWFEVPEREKPWGTTHALLCTRKLVNEPFMVINADDFYGMESYQKMYDYLTNNPNEYCMMGFQLSNTLTENGSVTRGVCTVKDGKLKAIKEISEIRPKGNASEFLEDDKWIELPEDTICSMNYWGFNPSIYPLLQERFEIFLKEKALDNPLKSEHVIPTAISELLKDNKVDINVLSTSFHWIGVTYREDKDAVVKRIQQYKDEGLYPDDLWQ